MSVGADLNRFYGLLARIAGNGGYRYLKALDGSQDMPARGVFFMFEVGEMRHGGHDFRCVHVGAHGLAAGAGKSLWLTLLRLKGENDDIGGDHRLSSLRKHVGHALLNRYPRKFKATVGDTWPLHKGAIAAAEMAKVRLAERPLEAEVSHVVRNMGLVWLAVGDRPSAHSHRGVISANAIRLLGDARVRAIDPQSKGWLGRHADSRAIRLSGLWNVRHVGEPYDPRFLALMADYVSKI